MKVAEILSDLKSLDACPPDSALKLVSVHKSSREAEGSDSANTVSTNSDPDLARASTLISLHQSVKMKYQEEGLDEELGQARMDVQRVLGSLVQSK